MADISVTGIGAVYEAAERRRRLYTFAMMLIVVTIIIGGTRIAEDANSGTLIAGLDNVFDYPADILGQAWERGWEFWTIPFFIQHPQNGVQHTFLWYLVETINMAILSTLIGFTIGAVVSLLASRNLVKNPWIVFFMRKFLDLARAFPEIVIALFLIYIIGKNPLAAVAAVAFHTVGALGKLFSEVTENADMKPWEGLEAAGANWLQKVWFGILPQVLPNWLSYTLLRFEINVRASAILGFVGAGGLGQQFKTFVDWKFGDDVAAIMLMLILTIIAIDSFSATLRRRLIGTTGH